MDLGCSKAVHEPAELILCQGVQHQEHLPVPTWDLAGREGLDVGKAGGNSIPGAVPAV